MKRPLLCLMEKNRQILFPQLPRREPDGTGWKVTLKGVREDEIWQNQFDSWDESNGMYKEMELERKGETRLYGGILLKEVIAMVDDPSGAALMSFRKIYGKKAMM